jgi:predicted lipoprotein
MRCKNCTSYLYLILIEMFMKRIGLLFFLGVIAILSLVAFSCKKKSAGTTGGTDPTLLNIGNNIILPGYQSLVTSVDILDSSIIDFNAGPDSAKLSHLRSSFKTAYTTWQSVSEYNYFGPAADAQPVLSSLNIFPTSSTTIENNISTSNYNVNGVGNAAAKGFPALDYLLFSTDSATLLINYTTGTNAVNRQKYLAAVSADIRAEANAVLNAWEPGGGNYINTFVSGTGNSISSSLGLLINSIDQDLELLKNDRLGIPLGKIPIGSSLPIAPTEVEAYHSGISVQLALAQLTTIQGIYLGTAEQGNGLGLNNYLTAVEQQKGLKYNGGLLSDTIKVAFTTGITDLQAVPDPLATTIQTSTTNANTAFAQMQYLVALLKTDLPSDLMVSINYGDTDGD